MTELGVGKCPERPEGFGHVWKSWRVDARRSCEFCGRPGRDNLKLGEEGGFFAEATLGRYEVVAFTGKPFVSGSGSVEKAWPKGMPPEMQARAAAIVEDKKRRDAEAVANGSARPGQIAGAPKKGKS